jgi:GNAT superfamily N-acetyltransferase
MNLIQVEGEDSFKRFLDLPKNLYKDDENWTCPLDIEIRDIFNPEKNKSYKKGEAVQWILEDDNAQVIGRIAAFYDKSKIKEYMPAGGCGFFECINNQEAANVLFDAAKEWLMGKGLKAMDGPINFGENLFHWGLLVDGFMPQGLGMPYNFRYYNDLFENYGFKNYFEQYSYHKDFTEPWPERQYKFAEYLSSRPEYSFKHLNYRDLDLFIDDFVYTYNTIWEDYHEDYSPLSNDDVRTMLTDMKLILDPELIWFAYANGKPCGMCVCIPDVAQILRKLGDGKLTLINKIKFFWNLKVVKTINRSRVVISGVIPEYQSKGIIAALFLQVYKKLEEKKHKQWELSWTGDYNKPVLKVYESVGAYRAKTHITYRYLFDSNAVFERFTNEEGFKSRKKRNS